MPARWFMGGIDVSKLRICLPLFVAAALVSQVGCCKSPWPCGNTYYGNQCACVFMHEWFSHKPCCCDPCDQCGGFTCSNNPYVKAGPQYTRFGEVYSDGSGSNAPGAAGQLYNQPNTPTPAAPQPGVMEDEGPQEELPGPTTSMPRSRTAMRGRPVASPPASRTLGTQPARTRLFTR
jgi:hypothetical protein